MHTVTSQLEQDISSANRRIALVWGAACLALSLLLWSATLVKITADRGELLRDTRAEVGARAKAYGEQVLRTVAQVDQISKAIKYQWEKRRVTLDIEEQFRNGVYENAIYPVVIDRDGYSVSAGRNLPSRSYMGDLELFKILRDQPGKGLVIMPPAMGRGGFSGRLVIRMGRRLEKPDGSFDGVVLVAIEPSYLASFHDESQLAPGDFITVRMVNGPLLASKGGVGSTHVFYNSPPGFVGDVGVRDDDGHRFVDGEPRLVGWRQLNGYPLVTLAAISRNNALQPYASTQFAYLTIATIGTLLLLLVTMVGAVNQIRNAARRRHELQVQSTFRLAVDGAREAFYMMRPTLLPDGRIDRVYIEDCNERAAEMSGVPRTVLVGKSCTDFLEGRELQALHQFFTRVLDQGFAEDEFHIRYGSTHAAGWFQRRGIRSGPGVAVTVRDVSEARQQAETLSAMARTDALTGLPNRHWLNDYLPASLRRAGQAGQRVAMFYIDLDNFKNINDALGHRVGDQILRATSLQLRSALRPEDHLVRVGGDEFVAIIEAAGDPESLGLLAARLIGAVTVANAGPGESSASELAVRLPPLRASVGISVFPQDGRDVDSLIQAADIAMYEAKSLGKSQYHFYDNRFAQRIRDRISLENALEKAIRNDEFVVYYQPRADARTGQLASMEALVRWRHPERGLLAPVEFIAVAEQTRLIIRLGELVLSKVCEQMAIWRDQGLPVRPVSVNVSALQLRGDGLRMALATSLHRYGLPSSQIAIELTESSMLDEEGVAHEELRKLREMGIELQIDDFGTGYSSLSMLQELEIDVVKIDQSFTRKLGTDEQSKALCESIVSIGRSLDITIVAEGVETPTQLRLLQEMGCDEIQGYLISLPLPPEKIPPLMTSQFFPPYRRRA